MRCALDTVPPPRRLPVDHPRRRSLMPSRTPTSFSRRPRGSRSMSSLAVIVRGDSIWDMLAARRARGRRRVGLLSGGYGQDGLRALRRRARLRGPGRPPGPGRRATASAASRSAPGAAAAHTQPVAAPVTALPSATVAGAGPRAASSRSPATLAGVVTERFDRRHRPRHVSYTFEVARCRATRRARGWPPQSTR